MSFIGRRRELAELEHLLATVKQGRRADHGVALLLRGRRRVGKSRLANEFVVRSGLPYVYFQAARGAPLGDELAQFAATIATSTLPAADVASGQTPSSLTAALTLLDAALPVDSPSVVILDEAPWLLESLPGGAGELQRVWDTKLSRKPVLFIILGSDLAMMEQLSQPDQPFFGRATEMILDPLTPRDVAAMTELRPFDAFDAYLVTGGLPLIAQEWVPGATLGEFLTASLSTSTSALVVAGNRSLDSEFGESAVAREVLTAIGGRGERSFTGIQHAARAGGLNAATLTTNLRLLMDKRIVAADEPLSFRPGTKDRRYRIVDPALRFWLAFVEPAVGEVDRGRPDLALARVQAGFGAWRGRAIEPIVRSALTRMRDDAWPGVRQVGGWWPRTNQPEIDLVGADRVPAREIAFVGTIKWRDSQPVTAPEMAKLASDSAYVPGVTVGTPLVAVCPAGARRVSGLARVWRAKDLLEAWPPPG